MPLIGGDINEMESAASRFAATGADTFARGTEISAFASSQKGEYETLGNALVAHIQAKASECQANAQQMRSVFETVRWHGNSRMVVDEAEVQLQMTLRRVMDSAQATAADFKAKLAMFVSSYEQEIINGQFLPAMENLKTTYEGLASATQRVAAGFEQADRSITPG